MRKETKQEMREIIRAIKEIPDAKKWAIKLDFLLSRAWEEEQNQRGQQQPASVACMDQEEINKQVTQQVGLQKSLLEKEYESRRLALETRGLEIEREREDERQFMKGEVVKVGEALKQFMEGKSDFSHIEKIKVLGVGEVSAKEAEICAMGLLGYCFYTDDLSHSEYVIVNKHVFYSYEANTMCITVCDGFQWQNIQNAKKFSNYTQCGKWMVRQFD